MTMRWMETKQSLKGQTAMYANSGDFCRIFKEDMGNLYLLALLLAADVEKAEECFVSGLDDCAAANRVFKEWARSWARRAVIQNAIRLVAPAADDGTADPGLGDLQRLREAVSEHAQPVLRTRLSAVVGLRPLERFVFVISVLERYSDQECALLLGCSRQELVATRTAALHQLTLLAESDNGNDAQSAFKIDGLAGNQGSTLRIPARLATSA